MKKVLKRVLLGLAIVLGVVLLFAAGLFTYLTITEYRPEETEPAEILNNGQNALEKDTVTVLSWNLGYCALGQESDFFMDGGKEVRPESEDVIRKNYDGILAALKAENPDFLILQEVDSDSKRSYSIDEAAALRNDLGLGSAYALNFSCNYVPYPLPTIGRVRSGLLTLTGYQMTEAQRISLPCPFSWPVSVANLKRCLLVTRTPISGTERELVVVNLHLEAYDDGEGKLKQTKQLLEFLSEEYEKGNYVIAGGDWNQIFPDTLKTYPNTHEELWTPGYLDPADLGEGWQYVWDGTNPTCRLLNQPYDPADAAGTQYYVIDGFLISPNLSVEAVNTLDQAFACSDHNPVRLTVRLGE